VGIDPQSRRSILDGVKELNRQGMTVLYTTHYMEEAQELSHRVGIIDHGELIALGTQPELRRQVGESDALVLHIGEGDDGESLAAAIRTLDGVSHVQAADGAVTVIAPEADEVLAPVITACTEAGVRVRAVEIKEPDLEAVFLHLTGRALRD
jgi:ABC-2 type transport system ATP-binding protein